MLHRTPRFDFKIVEEGGIKFIEEVKGAIVNTHSEIVYNPLTYKDNDAMPQTRTENIEDSPQVSLANLDLSNQENVLSFYKTWGLLGLQNIDYFIKISPEDHRGIQLIDLFRSKYGRNREPFFLIEKAVNHFQKLNKYIGYWKENKNALITEKIGNKNEQVYVHVMIQANINHIIESNSPKMIYSEEDNNFTMTVFSKSLYGHIYARTLEDLEKGTGLKICQRENCRDYFRPTRSDRMYCSINCHDAVRKKAQRIRNKAIKELSIENPEISIENIENLVKQVSVHRHLSIINIKELFYAELPKIK